MTTAHESKPDPTAIERFVRELRVDQLVAIPCEGGAAVAHWAADPSAAAAWAAERNKDGWNLYWSLNAPIPGLSKKATKAEITHARYLYVDIDPEPGASLDSERARIRGLLEGYKIAPTLVIFSGGGYQAVWMLETPIEMNGSAELVRDYERHNRALEADLGGDNCHNIDRVFRLPGTVNHPNARKRERGRTPMLAVVLDLDLSRRYPLSRFRKAPAADDLKAGRGREVAGVVPADPVEPERLAKLVSDKELRRRIIEGPKAGNDRSKVLVTVCCDLIRAGLGYSVIAAIVGDPRYGISAHALEQADPARAISRAISWARDKAEPDPARAAILAAAGLDSETDAAPKKSQTTRIVELARELCELWHTPDDEPFATIAVSNHREHVGIESKSFREWLGRGFYERFGAAPGRQSVSDAASTLAGMAKWDGAEHEIHVRVAGNSEAIYIDLCDPEWRVVEITARGWRVVEDAPVRFVRRPGAKPLPMPVSGGSIDELEVLHPVLRDPERRALVASWLVGAFRPWGSYALLAVIGEQGSGKSWLARQCLELVDPTVAGLRRPPATDRDLASAIRAERVIAFDNLGTIPAWLSDCLCTTSTGGTFAARELYTNSEEHLVSARQPVLITAIKDVVTASDLRDRSLVLRAPALEESERLEEMELADRLANLAPRLLGALLDAVSRGLKRWAMVKPERVHRFVDHVRWAVACEVADVSAIEQAHRDQRQDAAAEQLADPLSRRLLELVDDASDGDAAGEWTGTMSDLLEAIDGGQLPFSRPRSWPRSARGMGNALRQRAPALRRLGYSVEEHELRVGLKRSPRRGVTIQRLASQRARGALEGAAGDVGEVGDIAAKSGS